MQKDYKHVWFEAVWIKSHGHAKIWSRILPGRLLAGVMHEMHSLSYRDPATPLFKKKNKSSLSFGYQSLSAFLGTVGVNKLNPEHLRK